MNIYKGSGHKLTQAREEQIAGYTFCHREEDIQYHTIESLEEIIVICRHSKACIKCPLCRYDHACILKDKIYEASELCSI